MATEKQVIVVGDVHGCLEELDELLHVISFNPATMRLVFLGDLMDRGPDPVGCVRRVRELGAECVMGNHEDKHLRWRKHEDKRKATGKLNPMKPMAEPERLANEALSDDDIAWMKTLPVKLHLIHNFWGVHAGCVPNISLDKQEPSQMMRVRYIGSDGKPVPLNPDKSQPEGTVYWATLWRGPESIIYGHCIHERFGVRYNAGLIDELTGQAKSYCLGIDTGCCMGHKLTAGIIDPKNSDAVQMVYIPAKRAYFSRGEDE